MDTLDIYIIYIPYICICILKKTDEFSNLYKEKLRTLCRNWYLGCEVMVEGT